VSDTITLTIEQTGRTDIVVDRAEYEAAKASGELDQFLDVYVSDMECDTTVVEPDGTEIDPYE